MRNAIDWPLGPTSNYAVKRGAVAHEKIAEKGGHAMPEISPSELKAAVESQHGGTATLAQTVPLVEVHNGQTVWNGIVHVFDLVGHPSANRAYAWSYDLSDGKRRFFAVLHAPPVNSPKNAVKAAIFAEARAK